MGNEPPPNQPNLTTPLQLRERYGLNIGDLAERAKVAPDIVYAMMIQEPPVEPEEAESVLAVISTLTGQTYTLENVQVTVYPPLPPELAMLYEQDQTPRQQENC